MFLRSRLFDVAAEGSEGTAGKPSIVTVNSAVTEAIKTEEAKTETPKTETKPAEEKKEPEKKEEKPAEDGLSEAEKTQAEQLFKALKNPETQGSVIEFLAKQAGYQKIETKQEAKEVKDEVLETLKESLGEQFDFLADKLAPAINKIVDKKLTENTKDIREKLNEGEEDKLRSAADIKQRELAKEYFDSDAIPDDILEDMEKMMDKISPTKDMTVQQYVETVFYAVAGKRKLTPTTKTSKERTEKNKNDAASHLASSGAKQADAIPVGSKKMNLNEAVKAAMEAVKLEE